MRRLTAQLVKHPMFGRREALEMVLRSARHCSLSICPTTLFLLLDFVADTRLQMHPVRRQKRSFPNVQNFVRFCARSRYRVQCGCATQHVRAHRTAASQNIQYCFRICVRHLLSVSFSPMTCCKGQINNFVMSLRRCLRAMLPSYTTPWVEVMKETLLG